MLLNEEQDRTRVAAISAAWDVVRKAAIYFGDAVLCAPRTAAVRAGARFALGVVINADWGAVEAAARAKVVKVGVMSAKCLVNDREALDIIENDAMTVAVRATTPALPLGFPQTPCPWRQPRRPPRYPAGKLGLIGEAIIPAARRAAVKVVAWDAWDAARDARAAAWTKEQEWYVDK